VPFSQDPGSFHRLAALLDWPFWHFSKGPTMEALHPVSDTALCVGVMAWVHLALVVVGSTALAYVLQRSGSAGRELTAGGQAGGPGSGAAAAQRGGRGRRRPGAGARGAPSGPSIGGSEVARAAVYALYASTALWCIVRVATVKLL
jgi:hypothetical protein